MIATGLLNPTARTQRDSRGLFDDADYEELRAFYRARPELAPTPLVARPRLAAALSIGGVSIKDESNRFGLNSFKVLGVRFALERAVAAGRIDRVTCATAGNHGRAVAHVARTLGLAARIYVPSHTAEARVAAIASEGADVIRYPGSYDDAVRASAADAEREGWTIVSDTGWPGYEAIPRAIMLGYTRLIDECAADWIAPPRAVIVQAGVGGLAAAVLSSLAFRHGADRPFTILAEPLEAACVMTSIRNGRPTTLTGPLDTIMAGLRCGEISTAAWPALPLADACVAVDDDWTREAMRRAKDATPPDESISAGPSGACGLAALLALCEDSALSKIFRASGLSDRASEVILINTERGE